MTIQEIKQKALEVEDLIKGTTVNERLYISGLMNEFDKAMESDKERARFILRALHVGEENIEEIIKSASIQ
jgi:hypothetical protein